MERMKGPAGGQAGWLGLEFRIPRPGEPLAAGMSPAQRQDLLILGHEWITSPPFRPTGTGGGPCRTPGKTVGVGFHLETTGHSGDHCSHEPA